MKKNFIVLACFLAGVIFNSSCKKGPGEGGSSSIKGKVYTVNYNSTLTVPQDSGYLGAHKVYIIYGDANSVGRSQDTDYNGSFEFTYLREGNYKVYVYSKNLVNHLDVAVVQATEITDSDQTVELPDFVIKTNKN